MKEFVYMVRVAYSTDDCDGIDTYLFRNFKDALNKYDTLIFDECQPQNSWVGSEVFNEYGEVNDYYTVDRNEYDGIEKDLYWEVREDYNYNKHVFIDLMKLEVK